MIEYVIAAGVAMLLSHVGGGYLGYKYGRRVELKIAAEKVKFDLAVRNAVAAYIAATKAEKPQA